MALEDPGNRRRIIDAYLARPWLTCVHTHVGSQRCPLELIAGGIGLPEALCVFYHRTGRATVAFMGHNWTVRDTRYRPVRMPDPSRPGFPTYVWTKHAGTGRRGPTAGRGP